MAVKTFSRMVSKCTSSKYGIRIVIAESISDPRSPPRRPQGPQRPPPRPPGGGLGGAGATFMDDPAEPYHGRPIPSRRTSPDIVDPPPPTTAADNTEPLVEPLRSSSPLGAGPRMRPSASVPTSNADSMPGPMPHMGAYPSMRRGGWPAYNPGMGVGSMDFGAAPAYSSGNGMPGASRYNQPSMGGRGVSFRAEAALSRPREEEEDRGEPQAGAPAGKRDIQ